MEPKTYQVLKIWWILPLYITIDY